MVGSNGNCWATTPFLCGAQLTYYMDADGSYVWSVAENDDQWAGSEELHAAQEDVRSPSSRVVSSGGVADVESSSPSSLVEGVEVGTTSSLRGAKRLTRNM